MHSFSTELKVMSTITLDINTLLLLPLLYCCYVVMKDRATVKLWCENVQSGFWIATEISKYKKNEERDLLFRSLEQKIEKLEKLIRNNDSQ